MFKALDDSSVDVRRNIYEALANASTTGPGEKTKREKKKKEMRNMREKKEMKKNRDRGEAPEVKGWGMYS